MSGTKNLKYHALSEYFPMLNFEDRKKLKESIAQIGLLEPIMLYEGRILDGRNRYEVCLELDIEPHFKVIVKNAFAIAIAANLARRHMSGVQRGGVLRKLYPPAVGVGDRGAGAPALGLKELPPEGTKLTTGQIADLVGLSVSEDGKNSQIKDFDYVKSKNPAKAEAVIESRISLSEALRDVRPTPDLITHKADPFDDALKYVGLAFTYWGSVRASKALRKGLANQLLHKLSPLYDDLKEIVSEEL